MAFSSVRRTVGLSVAYISATPHDIVGMLQYADVLLCIGFIMYLWGTETPASRAASRSGPQVAGQEVEPTNQNCFGRMHRSKDAGMKCGLQHLASTVNHLGLRSTNQGTDTHHSQQIDRIDGSLCN
jgi:hypothetical protein